MNILADENIPGVDDWFHGLGPVRRVPGRSLCRDQLHAVDVLLVRSVTRVDAKLLAGTGVRFVGSATSGVDHVDRDYLAGAGIAFAAAAGANANSVVEYVLAAVAAAGEFLERLLDGGRVGIVGAGHIGSALARRLAALGIDYRVHDPWLDQDALDHHASLEEVLDCDVISLHPELTRRAPWPSLHLIGARQLEPLSQATLLINASRGAVVDNGALKRALGAGRGPTTVLDVWEGEPHIDRGLLELVTLGSAHIAGYSHDGKLLATRVLREACGRALEVAPANTPASPAGAPVIAAPAGLSTPSLLRSLLAARYDIREDDRLLRTAVLDAPDADVGRRFDGLRRHYRVRRELAGSTVQASDLPAAQQALLAALDCRVEARGAPR